MHDAQEFQERYFAKCCEQQQTFAVQEYCKSIAIPKQISGKGAEEQRRRSFASCSAAQLTMMEECSIIARV